MERAKTDTGELAYEVAGTGEPVVFIHGSFIGDTFRPLLNETSLMRRYRLILYHRIGYGSSSRASQVISVVQQAADCRALLRQLGVERAHVVGHSYGGAVALQLALDSPGVVHTLALLEPALMLGASAQGYRESLARGIKRYQEVGAEVVVDEVMKLRWPGYRAELDRTLPDAFAQALADAETSFEFELPGLLEWRFGEAEARRISQPTLSVLGGDSEALWPRLGEAHRTLLAWLPHIDEEIVPGTTHFMQIEDPKSTARALAEFWTRHPLALQ